MILDYKTHENIIPLCFFVVLHDLFVNGIAMEIGTRTLISVNNIAMNITTYRARVVLSIGTGKALIDFFICYTGILTYYAMDISICLGIPPLLGCSVAISKSHSI